MVHIGASGCYPNFLLSPYGSAVFCLDLSSLRLELPGSDVARISGQKVLWSASPESGLLKLL